jgi:hypothetical protein
MYLECAHAGQAAAAARRMLYHPASVAVGACDGMAARDGMPRNGEDDA